MATVARFEVGYTQYLNARGEVVAPLPEFARDPGALIPLYRAMVLTRTFDAKAVALQRTGQLGTFAASLGQEAVGVGTASAMRNEDVLLPSYRDLPAQFLRGVTMTEVLTYWGGNERGGNFAGPREDFPFCVPIATQVAHAAGVAFAFKYRGQKRVAVSISGDGSTSKGDFHEAANVAGVWKLPMVFVVNNNQFAISVRREIQTASQTIAQKAIAHGFEGEQVDGNDVIAVRDAVGRALGKARSGGGPTLVEAVTYRLCDHTTADDASRYRSAEEVSRHWNDEPIARLRKYLGASGAWTKADEEALIADCARQVQAAVDDYLALPPPQVEEMFDHVYATLPLSLKGQRAEAQRFAPELMHGEKHHG